MTDGGDLWENRDKKGRGAVIAARKDDVIVEKTSRQAKFIRAGIYAEEPGRIKACIEDEIKRLIRDGKADIQLFSEHRDFMEAFFLTRFQLAFIQLQMSGERGFQAAKYLNTLKNRPLIIFVSRYEGLAFDSQEYRPLWFVRERLMEQDMRRALSRYFRLVSEKTCGHIMKGGIRGREILSDEIVYLEYSRRQVTAKMRSGQEYQFYGSLKSAEKELPQGKFIRIHRNYMVNLAYIDEVAKREVILSDGTEVPMGRDRRTMVKESVARYGKGRYEGL